MYEQKPKKSVYGYVGVGGKWCYIGKGMCPEVTHENSPVEIEIKMNV